MLNEADEVVVQVVPPAVVGQALLLAHDMARRADEEVCRCRSVGEIQGESLDGGRRQPEPAALEQRRERDRVAPAATVDRCWQVAAAGSR